MTEKQVKDALKFLCVKYKMNYTFAEFENYMGTNANIETYNYYNKYFVNWNWIYKWFLYKSIDRKK